MHIDITLAKGQPATVLVDGIDIAKHIKAEGFTVGIDPVTNGPLVTMQLRPQTLTLDVDDPAVVASIAFLECPEPRCRALGRVVGAGRQRGHQGRHVLADSPFPGQHVACTNAEDCESEAHILACPGRR